MSDLPAVCLIVLTYAPPDHPERATAAVNTLVSALNNIGYSGPLNVHIADDGSPESHREDLREVAGGYDHVGTIGLTNTERAGYGASYNRATQSVHSGSEIVIPLEDDWRLTRPLDLDPLVATLVDESLGIRCIRFGYVGFTDQLAGEFVHTPAGPMVLFDPDSIEQHVFAGHARIETRDFERAVGPWPEGLAPGATEFEVAHRPEARRGIAWPLNYGPASQRPDALFVHEDGGVGLGEIVP